MRGIVRVLALLCAISGSAAAQTQVLCNQGSSKVPCTAPLLNTYPNWAAPGSLGSGTPNTVRGTTITATTQFTGSGAGLTNVPASSVAGSLSGVTIDCSSNTCQNIANAALIAGIDALKLGAGLVSNSEFGYLDGVTSSIQTQLNGLQPLDADLTAIAALSTTGLSARVTANTWALRVLAAGTGITVTNGDGVAGDPTIALTNNSLTIAAGTGLSVAGCSPVGLGGTCTPSIANTAVSAASYPTSGQIPTFTVNAQGQLTAAGSTTTLTSPAISSPALSGTATGTYTLGGTPTIAGPTLSGTVAGTYTIGGTPTLGANLAAGSNKITGLATATTAGDALAYPWITATASFNTLGSGFTITAANGTYAGTGLTYTFSGAGTYWCVGTVRSSVAVSAGAGANISLKLRNTTTSTDLTNSIRIGAYASTVGAAYITTTPMAEVVTVTGADTIEVYAASNAGTTYTARSVDSDTAGYSKLGCMKIAP